MESTMPHNDIVARYAKLLLEFGVNLQIGQCLQIGGEPHLLPVFYMLAEEAYRMGAKYVHIEPRLPKLQYLRAQHSRSEFLEYHFKGIEDFVKRRHEENWARIVFTAEEFPGLLSEANSTALSTMNRAARRALKPYSARDMANEVTWLVASFPSLAWAGQVYGEETPGNLNKLWAAFRRIMRLDEPDPIATWWQHDAELKQRCAWLENRGFDSLHFTAPGTDFSVGLIPHCLWEGGSGLTTSGVRFTANLPTEEVCTTPDWRATQGHVTLTRPFILGGVVVENAQFTFERGRVVSFSAHKGQKALEGLFAHDEQSRFLGEVALVSCRSPIFRENVCFHDDLFDENAACHIALGSGYPTALPQGAQMPDEELSAKGCNVAMNHHDMMFGCDRLDCDGIKDGARTPILRNGEFCF